MENAHYTWVNGEPDANLAITDRGLAFGDGLFETIRVEQQQAPLLAYHLQRLQCGAERLGIGFPEARIKADMAAAMQQATAGCWRLKYILTRGNSVSGYQACPSLQPNRIMQLQPFTRDVPMLQQQGVQLRYCDWRLAQQPALAGLKTLNRLDQVMARQEWQDDSIFEGLMADQQGHWVEGTMSNLFVVQQGHLLTPSLEQAGVAGVMRRVVLELAADAGIPCSETVLADFNRCDEVFITNALIGIVPAVALAGQQWPVGPITRRLQQHLHEKQRVK